MRPYIISVFNPQTKETANRQAGSALRKRERVCCIYLVKHLSLLALERIELYGSIAYEKHTVPPL